ncbi:MAG: double-strand break repair protein AddB [Pseudomonadota bacterium]
MDDPRLFAVPLGAPYPAALVDGLIARLDGDPDRIAQATIYANSGPMARALADAFAARAPILLPKITPITEVTDSEIAPADALRIRLDLTQLTARLIEANPGLAPEGSAFDIAGSLMALFGEMAGEGVPLDALTALDLAEHSAHWAKSLAFIELAAGFLEDMGPTLPEAAIRAGALALARTWEETPPETPVVIAGSTGSRGITRILMECAARLEQGYVVLPGFDFQLPDPVWGEMGEDHPQFRFRDLCDALNFTPRAVSPWAGAVKDPARAEVLSLALRPPPVTDQWIREGVDLPELTDALSGVTLLEAPSPREEAVAIALGMREAVDRDRSVALISPDRILTRQVTAALGRWGIEPDDSAGRPLAQSAPGRLLRQVSALFQRDLSPGEVLALIKHPLVAAGGARGDHLLAARECELWLRRERIAALDQDALPGWAEGNASREAWATWLGNVLFQKRAAGALPLADLLERLIAATEALVAGPDGASAAPLWEMEAGAAAKAAMDTLAIAADGAGAFSARDFQSLLDAILQDEVRNPVLPHQDIMIRGTIEARAVEADVVILAGLNEDVWPPSPGHDPWLNRALRRKAGLLAPERRVGLAAHDFEQAFGAKEVWISRTKRADDGETVASRWVNRLTNLVAGLSERNGPSALAEMSARGAVWLDLAARIDRRLPPAPPEPRPSPCPPVAVRPKRLSVTAIKTLIRDPYAIYARNILRLSPLEGPPSGADPRLRGTVFHRIAELFVAENPGGSRETEHAALLAIAERVFDAEIPWVATRRLWLGQLARIADAFLDGEAARQAAGSVLALEAQGRMELGDMDFTLTGTADRIDLGPSGLLIYDYKSGAVPSAKEVRYIDRQLFLEAVMAEAGAFDDVARQKVAGTGHIGLGAKPVTTLYPNGSPGDLDVRTETILAELRKLIGAFQDPAQGYPARRVVQQVSDQGDYDHLARFGEWDDASEPTAVTLC